MFVEQRLYTCAPGQTGEFLKVYEQEGRAPQMQHLGQPVGYYVSEIGMLNQVTTLWAYGSLDERVERRRALFRNADWNAYLNKARPLLTTQETRILVPAPFFQERLAAIASLGGAASSRDESRGRFWRCSPAPRLRWRVRPRRRRKAFRQSRSSSSCRWRPAAASISPHGRRRRSCRTCSASRWWWKIRAAPAAC